MAARREEVVKLAEGHVLRTARTLARGEEVGRARASAVRDLAEAMVVDFNVVAKPLKRKYLERWQW